MDVEDPTDEVETEQEQATEQETQGSEPGAEDEALREPGKKALAEERKARKAAEHEIAALKEQLSAKDKSPEEQELDRVRQEATSAAVAKANQRIIRTELKAAAKGRLQSPELALKLVDLDGIEVDDDGEIDSAEIESRIDALLEQYPGLAANAKRFQGGADQGAQKKAGPSQLSRDDLKKLTPEQVLKADREGRLDKLKGKL